MPMLIFIYFMMVQLICKYEHFWQEVSVELLILRWPFRPLGLLSKWRVTPFSMYEQNREKILSELKKNKLSRKHPWVKGIGVFLDKGSRPFPWGDYYEIAKIHWQNFKKRFFWVNFNLSLHKALLGEWNSSFYK